GQREIDTDDAGFLGSRKQPRIGAAGAADRNGLRIQQIVGLVVALGADRIGGAGGLTLGGGVGQHSRRALFARDAEPAIGDVEGDGFGFVDFLVAVLLQALLSEIADKAFMQDVVARDLRRAVARDQCERIERDRRGADIADVVPDGEEIAVVDRNGAAEGEALAIVVFQSPRIAWRQTAGAFLLPHRVLVGDARGRTRRRYPAEFRVIGVRGIRRRVQHDRWRLRIDGIAEFLQRQVVDARALQRDAAGKPRRLDLDAGRARNRGVAADDGLGRARLTGRRGSRRRRARLRGGAWGRLLLR